MLEGDFVVGAPSGGADIVEGLATGHRRGEEQEGVREKLAARANDGAELSTRGVVEEEEVLLEVLFERDSTKWKWLGAGRLEELGHEGERRGLLGRGAAGWRCGEVEGQGGVRGLG